jgi:hypothetical protein
MRGRRALALVVAISLAAVAPATAQDESPLADFTPPPLPPLLLRIEVEGSDLETIDDAAFYGARVPRQHFHGAGEISEERFFEIIGDVDNAERARRHRRINLGIASLSIASFFSGLVVFSAAGSGVGVSLVGASLVPAVALIVRGDNAVPLPVSFRAMQRHNEAVQ